jgi:hypothetical protein
MTLIETFGLIGAILAISVAIAYYLQKGTPAIGDFTQDLDQELEDKPKKKKPTKPKTDIVFPPEAVLHLEDVKEEVVFEPAKPKKKRKYYPKKKPTN